MDGLAATGTGPDGSGSDADRAATIEASIFQAIVEHRLPPGTKLAEAEVSAAFEVSRTITRRALQALAHAGVVRIERHRGAFVARPTAEEARQVFAARRLVEPELAREAAGRCTAADRRDLEGHLDAEKAALARGNRGQAIRLSGSFHARIAAVAGNEVVARFLHDLIARTSLIVALYGRTGASACGSAEHKTILRKLARGDGDGAARAMHDHLAHIEADLALVEPETGQIDLVAVLRPVRNT